MPPFFGAEVCEEAGERIVKGRGACDTKVLFSVSLPVTLPTPLLTPDESVVSRHQPISPPVHALAF